VVHRLTEVYNANTTSKGFALRIPSIRTEHDNIIDNRHPLIIEENRMYEMMLEEYKRREMMIAEDIFLYNQMIEGNVGAEKKKREI
jgi:hypothetical protein